jgi:hypothetical protein
MVAWQAQQPSVEEVDAGLERPNRERFSVKRGEGWS